MPVSKRRCDGPAAASLAGAPGARWWLAAALTGALAATAVFYAVWLPRRPFTDEGSACTLAQGLLRGQVLYRDLANEKAPGQYVLTAGYFAALGSSRTVLRLVPAVSLLLTVLLAARLAGVLAGSRRAAVAAGVALLVAAPAYQAYHDLAETSLAVLAVASATLLLAPPARLAGGRARFLALGAALALGLWFKQTFVWAAIGFVAAPAARGRRSTVATGAAVVWAVGLAAAWWHSGPALFQATILDAVGEVADPASGYARWPTPAEAALCASHLAVLGAVLLAQRGRPMNAATNLGWIAAAMTPATLPRINMFRLWPAAPLLVVAAVVTAALEKGRRRALLAAAIGGWALFCALVRPPWAAPTFREIDGIAAEVARLSGPDDTIWVGPHEPNIYAASGRRPAARHIFVKPWYPPPAARAELAATLRRAAPRVIVDVSGRSAGQGDLRRLVPGLDALLAERYERRETLYGAVIYVLRAEMTPVPVRAVP
jgi:hypothetical protein